MIKLSCTTCTHGIHHLRFDIRLHIKRLCVYIPTGTLVGDMLRAQLQAQKVECAQFVPKKYGGNSPLLCMDMRVRDREFLWDQLRPFPIHSGRFKSGEPGAAYEEWIMPVHLEYLGWRWTQAVSAVAWYSAKDRPHDAAGSDVYNSVCWYFFTFGPGHNGRTKTLAPCQLYSMDARTALLSAVETGDE